MKIPETVEDDSLTGSEEDDGSVQGVEQPIAGGTSEETEEMEEPFEPVTDAEVASEDDGGNGDAEDEDASRSELSDDGDPQVTDVSSHDEEDAIDDGHLSNLAQHRAGASYDEFQARIVEASASERLYVTAGPGTGKTHTLIEKLKYMLDVAGCDPEGIVVMSFTRAAVQVIKDRLQLAALKGELSGNWQAIDVTTFDTFCTRLLYWLKEEEPKRFEKRDISSMDYDHRIYYAAKVIRETPELMGNCEHLIVDETQDLVDSRARSVLSTINALSLTCGVTLLGDRCQSIYDYQVKSKHGLTSESFFDELRNIGGFTEVSLNVNYRQPQGLSYSLDGLREALLSRDIETAGKHVGDILNLLDEPKDDLRMILETSIDRDSSDTLGILTRTNAQAIYVSMLLYTYHVPHTLLRAEKEAFWTRTIADVLYGYDRTTIDEETFVERAQEWHLTYEEAMRQWVGLTSLRMAKPEGQRYKVRDLLYAMTEEIVPESLSAQKAIESHVVVSTVHGSKGREFDRVLIMDDDLRKASCSVDINEMKVSYVALSRARKATYLQRLPESGLHRNMEEDRCYRKSSTSSAKRRRPAKKRLTHIEFVNSKDLAPEMQLYESDLSLQVFARSGKLEGLAVRLCIPEGVSDPEAIPYEIETDDGIYLGKTSRSFISYYLQCYKKVIGGEPRYLPEAFDGLYVDRIVTFVGRSATAPASARRFDDYAIWYGFTLGGFAHVDDSQGH